MRMRTMLLAAGLCSVAACAQDAPTLKDAYRGKFLIGVALNADQIMERDARAAPIVAAQFNAITPENALKWERVHPKPDRYDFAVADGFVALCEKHGMVPVGHVLLWHNQTPDWVFRDAGGKLLDREALLARLRDHIQTVVGRYKGKIKAWDVVNEAIDDDGHMRQSLWYTIVGGDYVAKAFQYAHEADPDAELIYNDYSVPNPQKRAGILALINRLKAAGVPVHTVGLQGHYVMDWPKLNDLDQTIADLGAAGVKAAITELDIDVLPPATNQYTAEITLKVAQDPKLNPWPNGLPDAMQRKLADRYAGLFGIFVKHRDTVDRVTFWGVTDGDSWKNDWPVKGRTDYPLLFDRAGKPKPAYHAVIKAATP